MALPIRTAFPALVAAQAAHSIEEYAFRLYDVLAPARAVSGMIGVEPSAGFIVSNSALILFGSWCYLARVRPARGAWRFYAWFWAVMETANGLAHFALAFSAGGYFPGLFTAPLLLAIGIGLIFGLRTGAASTGFDPE